mmetsp:Transcript_7044/g.11092  ORF Transcript_7044/g.11092 Transcript_7044/m.11092 type:complete len:182 (-) Transcript_7044:1584-2129(-)
MAELEGLVQAFAGLGLSISAPRLRKEAEAAELSLAGNADKDLPKILNLDLRKFGEGSIPEGLGKADRTVFKGPAVLQVSKVVNCAEPSYTQHHNGPNKLLLMLLTDGKREISAVEYGPIQGLTLNTVPGTKVKISNADVLNGLLLLEKRSCAVLGGNSLSYSWTKTETQYAFGHSLQGPGL